VLAASCSTLSFGNRTVHASAEGVVVGIGLSLARRFLLATVALLAVAVAFLRGDYLFGVGWGIAYAAMSIALIWLLTRRRSSSSRGSFARVTFTTLLAMAATYAMAFPASISPSLHRIIDEHTTVRRARKELAAVFASDDAYSDLSMSSSNRKVIAITVHGSLSSADLERVRSRIRAECPVFERRRAVWLVWDVFVKDFGWRRRGHDEQWFENAESGDAADSR